MHSPFETLPSDFFELTGSRRLFCQSGLQYHLCAAVFLCNTERHSLKHRSQALTHLIEKPSFSEGTQPHRGISHWQTIQTKLLEVISGANTFFSHDFEKTLTIDDYCSTYGMDDTVKIAKYAIVDLNQDYVPEIVLGITENEQSDYGFLVLRYENGSVVGYDFTYRQMIDLKKDGTFGYLGGVADTGYACLNFTDNRWESYSMDGPPIVPACGAF